MRYSENEKETFKKRHKKEAQFKIKKKGKCYNCGKKRYFAKKYRSFKANHAKIDNSKKERERKT
jgi:UTP-glucose-1-phosphate uridylyltransferase